MTLKKLDKQEFLASGEVPGKYLNFQKSEEKEKYDIGL
jgi:hypothetical protein